MKLSEVEIFRELSGEYPVLILDDVMSELDLPAAEKTLEAHFRRADDSHLHARGTGVIRYGM